MTASLGDLIREWIREAKNSHPATVSADGGALLLVADMGGACYIRPDGTILTHAWDSDLGLTEEKDLKVRTSALVHGIKKHPELAALLPHRSSSSKDCKSCAATGWVAHGQFSLVCGECAGLGWLHAA